MTQISVDELYQNSQDFKDEVIMDVRTRQEYERGHIEGSINLSLEQIDKETNQFVPNMKTKIYVYCLSGSRSKIAVSRLEKMGYEHVFDVTNGLLAWRAKSFPLVT